MRRREFISLIAGATAWPVTGRGQQTMPVVGFVFSGAPSAIAALYVKAFKRGLEEVGFIEGQNVAVEYNLPGAHDERLPALMDELVQRAVPSSSGILLRRLRQKEQPRPFQLYS